MIKNTSRLVIPFVQRSLRTSNNVLSRGLSASASAEYNKSLLIQWNNNSINNQLLYRNYSTEEKRLDDQLSQFREDYDEENDGNEDEGEDADKEIDDIDEEEQFFDDIGETLCDIHNLCLDHPLPLYKEVRYQLHTLHNEDKGFWTVDRLSKVFKIHPGRVVALIRYVDMEKKELAEGNVLYTEIEDLLADQMGMRIHDDYLGDDEHQSNVNNNDGATSFQSGLATNIEHLHNAYKIIQQRNNNN